MLDFRTFALTAAVVATISLASPDQALGANFFVNKSNPTPGGGESWGDAFVTLQDALAAAESTLNEDDTIRIAEGTYYVDEGLSGAATREDTFFIEAGTVVLAGYPTSGSPGDGDRNPLRYRVTLSGDIDRTVSGETDDYSQATGLVGGYYDTLSGNSLHVVRVDDEATETTRLEGITVQGGNADGEYADGNGAGIYCGDGYPFIRNCVIRWNRAKVTNVPPSVEEFPFPDDGLGGGIFWQGDVGKLTIRDTLFQENHAYWGGGLYVYTTESASPENSVLLVGCTFLGNHVTALVDQGRARGGGATLEHGLGAVDIVNCDFSRNIADTADGLGAGGAAAIQIGLPIVDGVCEDDCASCYECSEECIDLEEPCSDMSCSECPTHVNITNTVFRVNLGRGGSGGAIRLRRKTAFNQCTFLANQTQSAGGAALDIAHNTFAQFSNCIIWGNIATGSSALDGLGEQISVTTALACFSLFHCDVEGLSDPQTSSCPTTASDGNIEVDPEFVREPASGVDGIWGTIDDDLGDLSLEPTSLCIDVGDDDLLPEDPGDVDDDSVTVTEGSTSGEPLPLDLPYRTRNVDGDCGGSSPVVDMGAYEYWCFGDLNGDCTVNGMDSAILLAAWEDNVNGYFPCPQYLDEDLYRDCKVNGRDLALLLDAWGPCPEIGGSESFMGGGSEQEDELFEMLYDWYVEENWDALLEWALSQLP